METVAARHAAKLFRSPRKSLGDLDAEVAARLIAAAADVAVVVDAGGIVRDLAFGSEELAQAAQGAWLGRPWIETVTVESRPKIEALIGEAGGAAARWRQVNHPVEGGPDVPVLYSAIRIGQDGRIVAVGRDLRTMASLQQRLVEAQQSIERDYVRLRHAETRYRLLFRIASEAVLIVDATTGKVSDANPAASAMLGAGSAEVVGRQFGDLFEEGGVSAVRTLLGTVRATGRAEEVEARLAGSGREVMLAASLFRQENASHFLIRVSSLGSDEEGNAGPRTKSRLIKVIESLPDGFLVSDTALSILTANSAFLEMAQLATEEQARGQPLERWLGRTRIDLDVLLATLREHGSVSHYATVVRGDYGSQEDVVVSAVAVPAGDPPCFGFTIRPVGRQAAVEARRERQFPRSVDQLTELIGRVPLKDLVRETTDVIERLCIETALEMTGDNRASAAELLGLSRQSLYAKLRRHGLGDLGPESEE